MPKKKATKKSSSKLSKAELGFLKTALAKKKGPHSDEIILWDSDVPYKAAVSLARKSLLNTAAKGDGYIKVSINAKGERALKSGGALDKPDDLTKPQWQYLLRLRKGINRAGWPGTSSASTEAKLRDALIKKGYAKITNKVTDSTGWDGLLRLTSKGMKASKHVA